MGALRLILIAGTLPACAWALGGKAIGMMEIPRALAVSGILAAVVLLFWGLWRKVWQTLRTPLLMLGLVAADAWFIYTLTQVIEKSYHLESFWWALLPSAVINLLRAISLGKSGRRHRNEDSSGE